jgi:hypothetical protein
MPVRKAKKHNIGENPKGENGTQKSKCEIGQPKVKKRQRTAKGQKSKDISQMQIAREDKERSKL